MIKPVTPTKVLERRASHADSAKQLLIQCINRYLEHHWDRDACKSGLWFNEIGQYKEIFRISKEVRKLVKAQFEEEGWIVYFEGSRWSFKMPFNINVPKLL